MVFLSSLLLVASAVTVQQPTVGLTRRTGAAAEPFSNVVSVQELPDGRVVVTDVKERTLSVVDFARGGTVTQLGRNGNGPNEYTSAQHLFRGPGDTLLLFDFPARRLLRIAPNGTLAGTIGVDIAIADSLPGENMPPERIASGARALDARGGLYYEVGSLEMGKGMRPDRIIARWDPTTRTSRIAARVRAWYPERSSRWRAPFLYQDLWAIAPDGRVARVVPLDYHVEWFKDGAVVARGNPVSVPAVRVAKEDRDAWYRARASQTSGRAQLIGPLPSNDGTDNKRATPPRPPGFTDADFPNVKPPFVEDYVGRTAVITNDGELWVTRAAAFDATTLTADVFDRTGNVVRHVTFPATNRIAGFGKRAVYVVRTDDDGLEWLERYDR